MTFLEFLCEEVLGPPTVRKGHGESSWPCPECTSDSFHTMPVTPTHRKERYRCFACGLQGDECDMIRRFYPEDVHHRLQLERLRPFRHKYAALPKEDRTNRSAPTYFTRGTGGKIRAVDPQAVALVWANLSDDERQMLIQARVIVRAQGQETGFDALADYCQRFEDFTNQPDPSK
jgi:hypothetical protein